MLHTPFPHLAIAPPNQQDSAGAGLSRIPGGIAVLENQPGAAFTLYIPAYLKKMELQQNHLAWQAEMG